MGKFSSSLSLWWMHWIFFKESQRNLCKLLLMSNLGQVEWIWFMSRLTVRIWQEEQFDLFFQHPSDHAVYQASSWTLSFHGRQAQEEWQRETSTLSVSTYSLLVQKHGFIPHEIRLSVCMAYCGMLSIPISPQVRIWGYLEHFKLELITSLLSLNNGVMF